jgi:allantoinase
MSHDLVVKNVRIVRPNVREVVQGDIAITGGKFVAVEKNIPVEKAKSIHDGKGLLAFPGVVDAHMHTGIYSPLAEDAISESRAAAQGGVTTSLNYFRSGQYYLNRGGPYAEFFPEVLKIAEGKFHVDYGFHLAPMDGTHISEIESLVKTFGVSSFKIFMFYGSHGLHGRSDAQRDFLMIGPEERYDYAHILDQQVMRHIFCRA